VLQAAAEFDAGDIWAYREFSMRLASKSAWYRHEVADAAVEAILEALARFTDVARHRGEPKLVQREHDRGLRLRCGGDQAENHVPPTRTFPVAGPFAAP
jgi:methionyl-tRNA formyltransferase